MSYKEFPFGIEKRLAHKLNLMVERLDKQDVWIIIDGDEGAGKTNAATYLMYWFACKTGRPFTINNYFYDATQLREFAQSSEKQIMNWDEAAIGGLSTEWWNKSQRELMQFAMTGRVKHHVIILCIPKFSKLAEYLIKDRSIALISVYLRKNRQYGRFFYFTKKKKDYMWDDWKRSHQRKYWKYKAFGGTIPEVFSKLFTEEEMKVYDKRKLDMIKNIGKKVPRADREELKEFKRLIAKVKFPIRTQEEYAKQIGVDSRNIRKWAEREENPSYSVKRMDFEDNIINSGIKPIEDETTI